MAKRLFIAKAFVQINFTVLAKIADGFARQRIQRIQR